MTNYVTKAKIVLGLRKVLPPPKPPSCMTCMNRIGPPHRNHNHVIGVDVSQEEYDNLFPYCAAGFAVKTTTICNFYNSALPSSKEIQNAYEKA